MHAAMSRIFSFSISRRTSGRKAVALGKRASVYRLCDSSSIRHTKSCPSEAKVIRKLNDNAKISSAASTLPGGKALDSATMEKKSVKRQAADKQGPQQNTPDSTGENRRAATIKSAKIASASTEHSKIKGIANARCGKQPKKKSKAAATATGRDTITVKPQFFALHMVFRSLFLLY